MALDEHDGRRWPEADTEALLQAMERVLADLAQAQPSCPDAADPIGADDDVHPVRER